MPANNKNLNSAKIGNDEFYTRWEDIGKIITSYGNAGAFANRKIYLPCDNIFSSFLDGFLIFFNELHVKSLTATSWHYPISYLPNMGTITRYIKSTDSVKSRALKGNGDFLSDKECLKIMESSDIIITNPPFSRKSELLTLLHKKQKDYLLLLPHLALCLPCVFPHLISRRLHCVPLNNNFFKTPSGELKRFGHNTIFLSTLLPPPELLPPPRQYTKSIKDFCYSTLDDDKDTLFIEALKDIPYDYVNGKMLLPVTCLKTPDTFLDFDILGLYEKPVVNGVTRFRRVACRWKKNLADRNICNNNENE
jgi:hypothetical protein